MPHESLCNCGSCVDAVTQARAQFERQLLTDNNRCLIWELQVFIALGQLSCQMLATIGEIHGLDGDTGVDLVQESIANAIVETNETAAANLGDSHASH